MNAAVDAIAVTAALGALMGSIKMYQLVRRDERPPDVLVFGSIGFGFASFGLLAFVLLPDPGHELAVVLAPVLLFVAGIFLNRAFRLTHKQ